MTPGNVVLIGMPGSGKSSLGRAAAERLGRLFFDLDEQIVRQAGMAIPDIFNAGGESGFRKHETEALSQIEVSVWDLAMAGYKTETGSIEESPSIILATGGGIVTRLENRKILRRLGTIIYMYRSPETLRETCAREGGRPLLADPERFQALWEARKDIYPLWADETFDADGPFDTVLDRLVETLKGLHETDEQ